MKTPFRESSVTSFRESMEISFWKSMETLFGSLWRIPCGRPRRHTIGVGVFTVLNESLLKLLKVSHWDFS